MEIKVFLCHSVIEDDILKKPGSNYSLLTFYRLFIRHNIWRKPSNSETN